MILDSALLIVHRDISSSLLLFCIANAVWVPYFKLHYFRSDAIHEKNSESEKEIYPRKVF